MMRDGRILNKSRLHAKGSLEAPMSVHEREVKFIDCLRWGSRTASGASFLQLRKLADVENLSGDDLFWSLIADR
jgi:hypothetical protein